MCFTAMLARSPSKARRVHAVRPRAARTATCMLTHVDLLAWEATCRALVPGPVSSGPDGGGHVWRQMELPAEGSGPGPREYHTLTALSGGRFIAYGGASSTHHRQIKSSS